jgi:hypothetical protein
MGSVTRVLPTNPRVIYISEGHIGPYPYVFESIPEAIQAVGCEVRRLDPGPATFDAYREQVASFRPDLAFCFLRHPWAVRKVAGWLEQYHPVPALNWFQEDPNGVTAELMDASRRFDSWFTIDARMVPFWPTRARFMPPAFDERVYDDFRLAREFDVSYVGQLGHRLSSQMYMPYMEELARYRKRALLCLERPMGWPLLPWPLERALRRPRTRPLLRHLPIWKCTWENPADEKQKALVLNRSRIHFGMSRVRGCWEEDLKALVPAYPVDEHGMYYQLKPRLFQAVGAGAMALNDYCPELEDLFEIGKEIVTFRFDDLAELREKLAWYTSHDAERERIAIAGSRRGRRQHTTAARVKQILDVMRRVS